MRKTCIVLLLMASLVGYIFHATYTAQTVYAGVLRLHVIANSDSQPDQQVKLKVRDAVLEYIHTQSSAQGLDRKQDVLDWVRDHILEIQSVANDTLAANGMEYTASLRIGAFDFPDRDYGALHYPAGLYDAVKIELGRAQGQNWWCVIFPPLCLTDPIAVSPSSTPAEKQQAQGIEYKSFFAQLFGWEG